MTLPSAAHPDKRTWIFRSLFYLLGLLLLALGITMNTKAELGVSPIISVSYSISTIGAFDFGNITLLLYSTYLFAEMILHILSARKGKDQSGRRLPCTLLLDTLQFPLSLVFTRFLNLFSAYIPSLSSVTVGPFWSSLPGRLIFLAAAILLTGVGAALSLNMRLIPNPGDGIVQAIADFIGKSVGLTKNWFDLFNVCLTLVISVLIAGHPVGIGLGTVFCVIGVGRAIALFNHVFFLRTAKLAGLVSISVVDK